MRRVELQQLKPYLREMRTSGGELEGESKFKPLLAQVAAGEDIKTVG